MRKLFDFVSIDPTKCTRGITNKTRIANAFTDALKDLSNINANLEVRSKIEKRGICKSKFIAGTYCYKSYRQSMNNYNKSQREKRHQLYIKQKWNQLYQSIHQEQQRLNNKVGRRIQRQIDSNNSSNSGKHTNNNNIDARFKLNEKINYRNFQQAGKNLLFSTVDSMPDAANRLNRCIMMAKKGCWKKADNALNPTKMANIHLNNNYNKTKSKFPLEKKKIYPFFNNPARIESEDLFDEVTKILLRMNPKASAGKIGISNKFLLWLIKNDDVYNCVNLIIKLIEKILYYGMSPLICELMMDSNGMIFGKEKDGQFDFDVRPIVVTPSIPVISN